MVITIKEILEATGGKLLFGNLNGEISAICTDSRKIEKGMFFVPLCGVRFDGHDYITQCFEQGAVGCVTDREIPAYANGVAILVRDTTKALGDIARSYHAKLATPIVAITGSVGKTTTKEMIAAVLAEKFNTLKTQGNFNNEIGMPLTLLKLEPTHEMAVVEMGMSGMGEIERMAKIAQPSIGVITNIGMSHIEKLGSQQNILKAKLELFTDFQADNIAILNADDLMLYGQRGRLPCKTVYYGIYNHVADIRAENIRYEGENGTTFEVTWQGKAYLVKIGQPGEHNVYNALAAIAVGVCVNIEMTKIIEGLTQYIPEKMRMQIYEVNGIKFIDDCYNASIASMRAALGVLGDMQGVRKVAILGDMLEMGGFSQKAHQEVGEVVARKGVDLLIATGWDAQFMTQSAIKNGLKPEQAHYFSDKAQAIAFAKSVVITGDAVLVKASRSMQMEAFIKAFETN
ncbi:MAG: UDP-N-acetylmuramoyl-tripeptide--D-alanyl-D-alanine ligase [Hyphomonadaceae bacterium]|nr:UDP-N-acetylmuramoyl-tripeptide--D-alanyl-D-alanine ligase [Clostridia bacterium]